MSSRSVKLLFAAVLVVVCPHIVLAQAFDVNVSAPASVTVGNTITYNITAENSSDILLSTVQVTSAFPGSLQFVSANPTNRGPFSVSGGSVNFVINQFNPNETIQFTLTLRATQAGTVTNAVTVSGGQIPPVTDTAVTTVAAPQARSDLSISITRPSGTIFVDDWVAYAINVSNQGDPVSGVFVTNVIPSGAFLQGHSPSNGVSFSDPRLIFNLGTLTSQQSTQLQVTIQPTTAGVLSLVAHVGGSADTNASNNTATNSLSVTNPVTGQLAATAISDQFFNFQNALIEQLIQVQNTSMTNIPSTRVILTNFPYRVVNAVGTNDGNPFVVHGGQLTNGQTVELLLEYAIPDRTPKDDPGLTAHAIPAVDLTPPSGGTNIAITNIHFLPPNAFAMNTNRVLLEFAATRGARYQIVYSGDMSFSPAFKAIPPIVAQANRAQWIDYGPPKTLTRPLTPSITSTTMVVTNMMGTNEPVISTNTVSTTNTSMRFYRAIQLP
jgi:uncharacterized repeat protein (TIGR01451 family)